MKKLFFLLLAFPLLLRAQEKTLVTVERVFPKPDKVQAFEKALKAHAQKFHKGDQKWRVYTIETGPDAGGYHIVEGPMTWDGLDKRGDLGPAHMNDFEVNIRPLLADRYSSSYAVFRADLSSTQLSDFSDKIAINHVYPKPGYSEETEALITKLKKVWDASGQSVAVYESSSSGEPQLTIVTRYKQGLKEREVGFRKPLKERYTTENGDGSWAAFQQELKNDISYSWTEMLFYKPALSSM